MSSLILNDANRRMPIGELLNSAAGLVELVDERGALIGTLVLATSEEAIRRAVDLTPKELVELRESRASPRAGDVTTAELMERFRQLEGTDPSLEAASVLNAMVGPDEASVRRAASLTEEELAELRRRSQSPRSKDVTTAELMRQLRSLEQVEQQP